MFNFELLKRMLSIYSGYKKSVAKVLGLTFILTALSLVGPFFYGKMINSLQTKENFWYSIALASIGIIFTIINHALSFKRNMIDMKETYFPIQEYVRMQTIDRYFGLSIGQHSNQHSGVAQEIMSSGEHAMQTLARTFIQRYLPLITRCVVISGILLYWFPLLALILISGLFVFVLYKYKFEKKYSRLIKKRATKNLSSNRHRGELLRGVRLIKSFNKEVPMREKYRNRLKQTTSFSTTVNLYIFKWDSITSLIVSFTILAVNLTGIRMIFTGNLTTGDLVTVMMWCNTMSGIIESIGDEYQQLLDQKEKVTRFFKLIDTPPAITEIKKPIILEKVEGFIDFKNISFSYPPTPKDEEDDTATAPTKPPKMFLKGVNIAIRAGQRVAIVGPSGSGKSTLITLLLRGYDPNQGSIWVDGYNLRDLSLCHYYRQIAVVDQSSLMLDMTIRECIQMGSHTHLSDDEIAMLCRLMELDIDSFEAGLDTKVGQEGRKLSGGERQRLAIARALASNPRILILDEATASLDGIAEAKIQRAINVASEGRTTIIIAHRLATVQHADKIFVLEEGKISAEGTHWELLRNSCLYMDLVEQQKILT